MQLPLHTLQDQLFNARLLTLYMLALQIFTLYMLTLFMLTLYMHNCTPYICSTYIYSPYICSPYLCSPYICSPYMYAHLIYKVHSADSKTDKGALHQPEKPNFDEIQPFYQKGRGRIKGFEAKLLQKVYVLK